LFVFNAISSPTINYRFIALNTGDILGTLHTMDKILCELLNLLVIQSLPPAVRKESIGRNRLTTYFMEIESLF